jgi:hypothetical protein
MGSIELLLTARSGPCTVREERDGAAGDEEPATKSRASSTPTVQEERAGRRCERNGPEGVETSTVDRHQSRQPRTSTAEAATERSEGVAGAKRLHSPVNHPQGEPSIRAKRVVGDARRAEIIE